MADNEQITGTGTGTGSGAGTPPPAAAGDAQPGGQPGQPAAGGGAAPFAVFPDAETFNARLSREAKGLLKKQAEELGFASVDAMLQVVKDQKQAAEAAKSEETRLKEKLAQLEAKVTATEAQARARMIEAEVRLTAARLNVRPEALDDLAKLADLSKVDLADGKVTGVEETLKVLLAAKPYLVQEGSRPAAAPNIDATAAGTQRGSVTPEIIQEFAARLGVGTEHLTKHPELMKGV